MVGSAAQVIRRPREEKELQEKEMADEANAVAENRNLEERSALEYQDDVAAVEDVFGLRYDRSKPYDTLATPALDDVSTYNIGVTYARMRTQGRVFMARATALITWLRITSTCTFVTSNSPSTLLLLLIVYARTAVLPPQR